MLLPRCSSVALLFLMLAAVGCSRSTGTPPPSTTPEASPAATPEAPEASPANAPANAPTPYTAEQIRDAGEVGREWQFRVVQGAKTQWRIMEMTAVDAEGATIRTTVRGGEGVVAGEPKDSRLTWEELRSHALFPAAATTIADETIETAAGTFDCKRYTVVDEDGTTTFWFAKTLPGAPVKLTVEKDGVVVETRMLMKHGVAGS